MKEGKSGRVAVSLTEKEGTKDDWKKKLGGEPDAADSLSVCVG